MDAISLSDGYSAQTTRGYTSLFRTFLFYTALEQWTRVVDKKKVWNLGIDHERFNNATLASEVRACDGYLGVLGFLIEFADTELRRALQAFYSRNGGKMVHIAAAIRHIFAHGILSSNSGATESNDALITVCALADRFVLNTIDGLYADQFDELLDEFERAQIEWLEYPLEER